MAGDPIEAVELEDDLSKNNKIELAVLTGYELDSWAAVFDTNYDTSARNLTIRISLSKTYEI